MAEASTTVEQGSTSTVAAPLATAVAPTLTAPATAHPTAGKARNLQPSAARRPARLILTLSQRVLTARAGRPVDVDFTIGRAASIVLRVKQQARTLAIIRTRARNGRNHATWDGLLGRRAAPEGAYRLDLYAVAADGRAVRASIALTVK